MISEKLEIVNDEGIHMRPAMMLSQKAANYSSDISIVFNEKPIDAKSIMQLMSGSMKKGHKITLICDGTDEKEAMSELSSIIKTGFGE